MVTQLGFLRGKLGSLAVGKRIGRAENTIEKRESGFDLEVMGSAAAAICLLVEFPYPFYREGFEGEAFRCRPWRLSSSGTQNLGKDFPSLPAKPVASIQASSSDNSPGRRKHGSAIDL